jgi:serine/threonine-protein kinase RsbW
VQRLRVPVVIESLDAVVGFVRLLSRMAGLSQERTFRLRLAVEELFANIVMHGYGGGDPDGVLELTGGVDDGRLWLRLTDSAPSFDPTGVPDPTDLQRPLDERRPGGLGLLLARSVVDEIRYEYCGGRNRTVVVVNRDEEPDPAARDSGRE